MKYAFIALIACYLLVYGCGPDDSKKAEKKNEQTVHAVVKKPIQPVLTTQVDQQPQAKTQPVAPVVDPQPAPSPPMQQANVVGPPPPRQLNEAGPQPPAVIEEQKSAEVAEKPKQQPRNIAAQSPGAVELTQPDEQNIVILPCGRMYIKNRLPANAPCLNAQLPPCPMMGENQLEDDDAYIVMPCGRVFVRHPIPEDDADLDQPRQMEPPYPADAEPQDEQAPEEDLSAAVQRMVEATNDMVLVTQQLVVATQEMLKATQGTGNVDATIMQENPRTENTVQTPQQTAEAPPQKQAAPQALEPKL